MKRRIIATVVADSISPAGKRITTFVLVFPRIILDKLNTHRVFIMNSASSRAIPAQGYVKEDLFKPLKWMKEHTGMQGSEYFQGTCGEELGDIDRSFKYSEYADTPVNDFLNGEWEKAAQDVVGIAEHFTSLGVTTQITNRLIEPFLWHKVIVTATDYENFFALRAHPQAEIHIQELAYKMLDAYNASIPKPVENGFWHIPFGDRINDAQIWKILENKFGAERFSSKDNPVPQDEYAASYWEVVRKIATARCSRVSYMNFDGKDDYEADIELYDKLVASGHWIPFEHCAYATSGFTVGNFDGWNPLRSMSITQNKKDPRVEPKSWKTSVEYWNQENKNNGN